MSALELYTKGARIWIPDPELVWRAAELQEDYTGQPKAKLKILYEDGPFDQPSHSNTFALWKFPPNYRSSFVDSLRQKLNQESTISIPDKSKLPHLRNPEILIGENDLTSLSYLNEPEVLYNLKVRFEERNIIYTYCGIVLVAVNPYEQLPIYGNDIIQAYSGQDMGAMDPHVFAVAEEAFKQMTRFERNQSIIVSGESGAGKTVSAKYAMRYFATVGGSQAETQVEQKVLASNPIMEAIGNAKTIRNDNSSRFGKYIEIDFSRHNHIISANMRTYLLEKSRVVFQAPDERNYHIFYQLCSSAKLPELKAFKLGHQDEYFYTCQGQSPNIRDVNDAEDLNNTRAAFSLLGVEDKQQFAIFQILAAILHFGNVQITEKEGECCEIAANHSPLLTACQLLGVEESQLRIWLCNRKIKTVGETLIKPLSVSQAILARDALSKRIYAKVFDWIVNQINKALWSQQKYHKFIGVLDIYGFETFEFNSFEQFCINYANEKLQQQFNMHVFKLEQEEYVREEIEWSFIDFYDNQPCIDLIEQKLGILDLLDEECKMPKGSDKNWCQKLYDKHLKKSEHFEKPRMSNMGFIICHFADKVLYEADGFLEKNRDTVLEDHINILKASEMELVSELFMEAEDTSAQKRARGSSFTIKPMRESPRGAIKEHRRSVGTQFRESLHLLMETLNATTPHYIRCIKPNDLKSAFTFDPKRAVEQLRACGVLETIRISAAGYPSRWSYAEFFQRYRVLAKSADINRGNPRQTCQNILNKLIQDTDKYRFGKTKIFFRAGQVAFMEKLRSDKLRAAGVMIQKHVRGWLQKNRYQKIQRTVRLIQCYGRGLLARRHALFLRQTKAATRIQKTWRGFKLRKKFLSKQQATLKIQSLARRLFARRRFHVALDNSKATVIQSSLRAWRQRRLYKRVVHGIVLLQSHYRRRRAKKELKKLKIEAKSVEHIKVVNKGLENKIIELQQRLDTKAKAEQAIKVKADEVIQLKTEMEKIRADKSKASTNQISELEAEIARLREELAKEKSEKQDVIMEKDTLIDQHTKVVNALQEEKLKLKEEINLTNEKIKEEESHTAEIVKQKVLAANKLIVKEFESERAHHQKLVKEHARLQQRLENLQGEMKVLTSPQGAPGHSRTPSNISMESFTSSIVDQAEKSPSEEEETEKADQGYFTSKKAKRPDSLIDKVVNEVTGAKSEESVDVSLILKLQDRIRSLEKEKTKLLEELDKREDVSPSGKKTPVQESALGALTMQELQNENDKLKREVKSLMASIASSTDFDGSAEVSPAGKEFMGRAKAKKQKVAWNDQFEAMTDELERRREECLQLRAMLADRSIGTHVIAKEFYGGKDELVNEDNEIEMAYKTQRDLNRLLQNQLDKTEKEYRTKEQSLQDEIHQLKKENERQQKLIGATLDLPPNASIEARLQHEITRLTEENLDLRETISKQVEKIRKLKKMLKVYARRLNDGDAAEIEAELEKDEQQGGMGVVPSVKHRDREYMGMLEFQKDDEQALIKHLITDLKPRVASTLLPGLPAYIMFMCVRHTDYAHDDVKVRSLLTTTIVGIKKVVKKHTEDVERVTLWLANVCRFLHNLKQYSGEEAFQAENTSRQNEQCLRNFDLSEYRQVFSDLAVWIYQILIKTMEERIQPMIVPAVLEHEAIAGLTASKPSGMRGRSSSNARDLDDKDYLFDDLMKNLNSFSKTLIGHSVDPELVKQVFRQLFYFISAGALNNLLLRKDMCNWSKGMQIRYNLSHLEQWLRDHKLQETGAQATLEPITQASQLLQARKTDADVDSICEMCSNLTVAQIVKILNLYTPVDEFEERVPISFIRKIQEKLKGRRDPDGNNTLLMDAKHSFPVTFPYNPSGIALETVEIPDSLHLSFLNRL